MGKAFLGVCVRGGGGAVLVNFYVYVCVVEKSYIRKSNRYTQQAGLIACKHVAVVKQFFQVARQIRHVGFEFIPRCDCAFRHTCTYSVLLASYGLVSSQILTQYG